MRAISGDPEAFGDLYERYNPMIYRYLYARVGNIWLAEDLTEAVFLRVWEKFDSFQIKRTSFKNWLYRIAHTLMVDHYHAEKQSQSLQANRDLPDPDLSLEDLLISKEKQAHVAKAMAALNGDYQHILALRFVNGLSHSEAAAVLGRKVGTIRVLQHRALKALSKQLENLLEGENE